ncbi:MAG: hypothetical protein HOK30_06495, partial [Rhodospirillaceae bacterium]|nr:hypothetical protein [Rhodospirillaceae bacterium]
AIFGFRHIMGAGLENFSDNTPLDVIIIDYQNAGHVDFYIRLEPLGNQIIANKGI